MRKFIVHTRPIPGHPQTNDAPSIIEVEGEIIFAQEDPSVMWLPNGEFRFRILKPEFLYESKEDAAKTKIMVAPIYYGHFLLSTREEARQKAEKIVKEQFDFNFRKYGTPIIYAEVLSKCKEIQEILL